MLVVLGSWVETRMHAEKTEEGAQGSRQRLWSHVLTAERTADSLSARVGSLERRVRRLQRGARPLAEVAEPVTEAGLYGPPAPHGELGKAISGIFKRLVFWPRDGG